MNDQYLIFAKELALEAGQIMRRYFRAEDIGTEWKEDDSPLTIADTMINRLVIERIQKAFPEHGVIGEEESYDNGDTHVWVVDPIDGTIPFSLGIPLSMFSLGLVSKQDGQSLLGVAYDPQADHLYWAVRGEGAFLNGESIKTSSDQSIKRNYVTAHGLKEFRRGRCIDEILKQGGESLTFQSQVYGACRVASGEFIGSIFGYGSPWDSAAVSLIVEEAGGVVTDLQGKPRRYDEWSDGCILSANETIHKQLVAIAKTGIA